MIETVLSYVIVYMFITIILVNGVIFLLWLWHNYLESKAKAKLWIDAASRVNSKDLVINLNLYKKEDK